MGGASATQGLKELCREAIVTLLQLISCCAREKALRTRRYGHEMWSLVFAAVRRGEAPAKGRKPEPPGEPGEGLRWRPWVLVARTSEMRVAAPSNQRRFPERAW